MRMVHESLLQYRKKLDSDVRKTKMHHHEDKEFLQQFVHFQGYKNEVFHNNSFKFSSPQLVIETMTCQSQQNNLSMWECVIGRCSNCPRPTIPHLETMFSSPLSNITYGFYKLQSRCKLHGPLENNNSVCSKCEVLVQYDKILIESSYN